MTVAILYFSGYGHTNTQAQAVAKGVQSTNAAVELIRIDENGDITEAQWETLNTAKAIIFGSPTYMGNFAWQFKKIADASSKVWFTQGWKDKIAAGFTCSASTNGNKEDTLQSLFTLSQQHGMVWVGTGLLPANKKDNTKEDENWSGSFTGAMAIAPSDANADELAQGDLTMAATLGKRVATLANKL